MRIISGKSKGKKLFAPKDDSIRPTTDRIKETIFNIVCSKIELENAQVLDLFCGSGGLGIEALSRGAARTVFVDKSHESVRLTQKNLLNAGLGGEVFAVDFGLAVKKLDGQKFDLIFLDPPYFDNLMQKSLYLIKKHGILAQNGIIVAEHDAKIGLQVSENEFIMDKRDFGSMAATFLNLKPDPDKTSDITAEKASEKASNKTTD